MKFFEFVKEMFAKWPFVCLLAVNVAFIAFVVTLLPFQFETCDDYTIAWRHSGYMFGKASAFDLIMHYYWAWFELQLYHVFPSVEWHTWLFLIIHLLSLSSIGFCIAKSQWNWKSGIVTFVFLYAIELYVLTNLQFTTTAGLAATAGLLLIIIVNKYWSGIVLFLLASMIRYESAMFCGVIVAAMYPLVVLRRGFHWPQLAVLALCAICGVVMKYVDKQVYMKDPEWRVVYEYNKLRSKVYDSSNIWRLYSSGIVSERELDLWSGGVFMEMDNWPTERLGKCLDFMEKETAWRGIPGIKKMKNIPLQLKQFWPWFVILSLVFAGCALNCKNRKERWLLLLGIISLPLALSWVALNIRLNGRAFLCGWIPCVLLPLILIPTERKRLWSSLATLLLIVNVVMNAPSPNPRDIYRQQKEVVDCGIRNGAKCFITGVGDIKYPFGIRLIPNAEIIPWGKRSVVNSDFLEEGSVMAFVGKGPVEDVREAVVGFTNLRLDEIVAEEVCSNDKYMLVTLKYKSTLATIE